MSGYSERSQELAEQLREKASRNLARSGKRTGRSASTGKFISSSSAARHPAATTAERTGKSESSK